MTRYREMNDFDPAPVGDNGIDIQEILQGSRTPVGGYSAEVCSAPVEITASRHCVDGDGDGTFVAETGNRMPQFAVTGTALRPTTAVGAVRRAAPVNLGPAYVYVPNAQTTESSYVVTSFFSDTGFMIEAPPDFDWWKYSNMFRDFSVSRAGGTLDSLAPAYYSLNRSFYQPYMDWRGSYWNLRATAPLRHPKVPDSVKHSPQHWVPSPAGPRSDAISNPSP